ncbi:MULTISPECIES: acetylornithine deacetylase [Ferrimonas]|uniref:acetylornithine deacetylase n=1 Tax=Ferrimonas TaxID=44011 RepID=UPI0004122DCE|nr:MULTISPECIES: acetylornithine deacetylase [Ferrimonas]USD37880.1 acetylornithine deacetylase [Ferrimonas sp. SCSIO 43195]
MKNFPDLKQRFQQLIATPSISGLEGEWDQSNLPVIELLYGWFSHLGFQCEVLPLPGQTNKANLLARIGPAGAGGLLLAGHTDTVPYDEGRWSQDPFQLTEKDQRWYGLGTCDMKGFFALILEAALQFDLSTLKRPLYILATADEETTMAGAKAFAASKQIAPDYALIGEPTGLRPVHMHKGHAAHGIRVSGRSGHSSDPAKGLNAIEVMHGVIGELMTLKRTLADRYNQPGFSVPYPTLNFGHIHGGDAVNRICGCCQLNLDMRPLPGMNLSQLQHLLEQALAPVMNRYPDCISITPLFPGSEPFAYQGDNTLLDLAQQLSGQDAEAVNYATEAPYINQLGCQTLVLGPGSIEQAHQPDEFVHMDYLTATPRLLSNFINKFCLLAE